MKALSTPLIGSFQFTTELTARSNYRHRRSPAHYWGALDFQTATPEGHLSSVTPTAEGCSLCWQAQLLRTCLTKRSARGAFSHKAGAPESHLFSDIQCLRDGPAWWSHLMPALRNKERSFWHSNMWQQRGEKRNACACWSSGNAHDFHTAAFEKHFIFLFFFFFQWGSWGMIVVHSHWWGIVDAALRSACLFSLCLQGIGWSYKWKQLRSVRSPPPPHVHCNHCLFCWLELLRKLESQGYRCFLIPDRQRSCLNRLELHVCL